MSLYFYIGLVAAAFIVLTLILGGVGLLVRRWFGVRSMDTRSLVTAPWLGWGMLIVILQVWHLAFPVNACAGGLVAVLGVVGLLAERRRLAGWIRTQPRRRWWLAVMLVLAALWLANQTTTQPRHPDTGLYHLASAKWAFSYSIVPGLGNLRNILAYNNSYFLYVAVLNAGPFVERYHHLATGLLVYFLLALSLFAWWSLLVERKRPSAWRVFDAVLLVPLLVYAMGVYGPSPSPDVGVWALTLVISSELLRLLQYADRTGEEQLAIPAVAGALCSVVFLAVVGVTVKLSFVATGLSAAALALMAAWWAVQARGKALVRPFIMLAAACLLAMGTWVVRGYITSGYPAYPSTLGGLPFEWRMPRELAEMNAKWLYAWGRMPDRVTDPAQALGHWRWIWLWLNDVLRNAVVLLSLLLAGLLAPLMVVLRRQRGVPAVGPCRSWLFLLVPLSSLVFWFFTSPQVRFVIASFLALGMGAFAIAARRLSREAVLAAVASLSLVLFAYSIDVFDFLRPWRKDAGPVRKGAMIELQTESGLTVYVPAKEGDACWDAPLPSTSGRLFLDPKLKLRQPGNLGGGFLLPSPAESE